MARETQKQLIARLEAELREYKELCSKLNAEILQMQEVADKDYSNSSDYKQMTKKVELLESKNELLESKCKSLNKKVQNLINELESRNNDNDIQELNNEKIKNERGAGRKSRFTEEQIKEIKMYRTQGKTLKEISTMYNCSVGLIHKLIN